tara:strand:+ start:5382 stop:7883 length:2502 start_codon:yes stop_codon:yes gene_type:complete
MKITYFKLFIIVFAIPFLIGTTFSGGKISTNEDIETENNKSNKTTSEEKSNNSNFTQKLSDKEVLTSYYYAKESGVKTVWFPKGFFELDINDNDLSTWIDVDGDGEKEIFVGILKYSVKNNTAKNAPNSDFQFLKRNKRGKDVNGKIYDSYYPENTLIDGKGKGCIHPRKGVVNDFNLDGKLDIFIACTGYDANPFPGEISKIILSQSDGKYIIKNTIIDGFTHGASSADFNGDGAADLILVSDDIQVWLNNGKGSFTRADGYLPKSIKNTVGWEQVELPDIDGDGDFDLFLGGNEYYLNSKINSFGTVKNYNFNSLGGSNNTVFFINSGNNKFTDDAKIPVPAVKNMEIIADVLVTGEPESKIAWILRTAGSPASFYKGAFVQKYNFSDKSSEIVYNSLKREDFDQKRKLRWDPWIISWNEEGKTFIGSKWQDDFFGFAFYADENDVLYLKPKTYTEPDALKPEPKTLKIGVDLIDGDIQNNFFKISNSESIRHGDYIENSTDIFLDDNSSEKFSIKPIDCNTSNSKDCNNNQQHLMMIEKNNVINESIRLYEWSMFLPEDHEFPNGFQVTYSRFLGEQSCPEVAASFVEYDDGLYLSLPADGTFRRDDTILINSDELIGKWQNFKLEINWSKTPENGYLKLMLNNEFIYEYKGQTLNCDEAYFTYGLLRSDIKESNLTKLITSNVYFDNVQITNFDKVQDSLFSGKSIGQKLNNFEESDLFDGFYQFTFHRYNSDEGATKLGSGNIEINNGEIKIGLKNRSLLTGPENLYDTFEGKIDNKGNVSGSIELDILYGKDRSEVYIIDGVINKKIWGETKDDDFFKVYLLLNKNN